MHEHETPHSHEESTSCCPVCGSSTLGDALTSGADIRFCARCTWCRVEAPDGEVEKEHRPAA